MEQCLSRQISKKKHRFRVKKNSDDLKYNEEDEQKRFVSLAVAFVIKNSCKGLVSLCTSVAELLKEKDRLQRENVELIRELSNFKPKATTSTFSPLTEKSEVTKKFSIASQRLASEDIHRSDSDLAKYELAAKVRCPSSITTETPHASVFQPKSPNKTLGFQTISLEKPDKVQCACTVLVKEDYAQWHDSKQQECLERTVLLPLGELKKLMQLANTYLVQRSSQKTAQVST